MKKTIDCFFVGHNQIEFEAYEKQIKKMGKNSGAYRDLSKNFIRYNNRLYSAADVYNLFCCSNDDSDIPIKSIQRVETFSAGIAYLGTYLHRRGFTFDFVNSFQDEKEYLMEKLKRGEIMAVAILTTLYVTPLPLLEIIKFVRVHNSEVRIIVGGPFISTKVRTLGDVELDYLFKSLGADFYVNSSQGEAALVKILASLKNGTPPNKINNIYYKTKESEGYLATSFLKENNILSENMVNWDLFSDRVGKFVNVRTSISCPFSCAFCGFPQHAGKFQTADVQAVENELNLLNKIKTVKTIHFTDDTFNFPVDRFKEILRMMIKNSYSFKWNSFFRCQFADREMVALMKESGCESVLLGIESGNPQILKNMNKFSTIRKYQEGIALLKEYGIITLGNFIIGFPGEMDETVQDTLNFIKKAGLDFYRAQLWYYEPITPIWRHREKYDLKGESFEWSHRTMNSQQACDWVNKIILSLEEPVRYPQYYFDYDNVIQLTYKGLTIEQVKEYLKGFDSAVKERLKNPSLKETSYEIITRIGNSCRENSPFEVYARKDGECDQISADEAEFDFF
jgi:radical SAM PhpK family P-methyltransferase